MPETRDITLADEAATTRLGAALAQHMAAGEVLLLNGELGMGKSTLARGLIRALTRPDEDVPSPTFTIVQFYEGPTQVAHFDLYRLEDREEIEEIGLYEALDDGAVLIEWPERLGTGGGEALSPDRLSVRLETDGAGRRAHLTGYGAWAGKLKELHV
ncbi:MAG: tRNA (adenosine(37)-N6)-threonylcarbamoyltransferase complex ATPase subunit type 1 TsaE [Brevundimonas sp.]|uniref:tRNA (adenosine(37)-N6)-threonylcarbamoyltransferase complex ATPase subunit type 1 TsaE n=1 Tax=Brevundimonas sp. TaxID=1871086 RepID=UPI002742CDAA|nr:tRNA (adenosine(37)-N6)-threonylcarbamoyltransferase complex ATPase subunit type 1 TsaE [Brevundimonas sp.]MDP3400637.1 tRNA (adenosine(37)-N6)-threonylcarbamoyltransferase complex ATPase subunit type 1 TsaE [Brevundimonas sp.]MDZ4108826.1 tRNA (adenosine(37)-N6)-threonylcarbamoyltransferase complex ATPase subunit type 1 TsaE [Brevundimonas sp.]